MTTLQISKEKAKELYPTASTEFKTMLEETFGKDFFRVSIMDRVKSFEDAYRMRNNYSPSPDLLISYNKDTGAFVKLKVITEVLNEGKEGKWLPIFNLPVFSHSVEIFYAMHYPRKLLLATKELSDYAGTQFIELYKDYLL